jgi:hypothetical protein
MTDRMTFSGRVTINEREYAATFDPLGYVTLTADNGVQCSICLQGGSPVLELVEHCPSGDPECDLGDEPCPHCTEPQSDAQVYVASCYW